MAIIHDTRTVTSGLGALLVDALDVRAGEHMLDVAAGTRNVAFAAALRGATVVAVDRSHQQLARGGRLRLEGSDDRVTSVIAEAEGLPFRDGVFDVAASCIGMMFAHHQQRAVDELLRVVRPGGRLGLLNWTPTGVPGRAFARLPVAEAWATGVSSAPLWGDESHVRELLGDRVEDVAAVRGVLHVDSYGAPDAFRRYVAIDRPTIAAHLRFADRAARRIALGEALDDLVLGMTANGPMEWEHLLVTATVR